MRGQTTIDLGFTFEYAETAGKDRSFSEASSVTVRAPGLAKFKVHTQMVGYVNVAMVGMIKAFSGFDSASGEKDDKQDDEKKDVMQIMAMGLGEEKFSTFCDYVRKTLTRDPSLAYVGDGHPMSDETWEAIGEAGGMEAVMKIIGGFTDFFMDAQFKSASQNGSGTSTSSASPTQGSTQSPPKASRSKN